VSAIGRPLPPLNADERTTLESWLDFHRATLAMKCEGLDDEQAAATSVAPSGLTLTRLLQPMAEVERNWLRRVLAGDQAPQIYDPQADPEGPDGGFELAEGATPGEALAIWRKKSLAIWRKKYGTDLATLLDNLAAIQAMLSADADAECEASAQQP